MFYLFRDVETKHHLRRNLCVQILEFERERKREKTDKMNVAVIVHQKEEKRNQAPTSKINDKNKSYSNTPKKNQ